MTRNIKNPNRIDEEQLCMDCFVNILKNQIGEKIIHTKRESNDPPDFWLEVGGNKYAVEVTSLTKDADFFPFVKKLAKTIETKAIENGWLSGKYILDFIGKPEIPRKKSTAWDDMIEIGLSYIRQTMNLISADERILERNLKGVLKIEKLTKDGSTCVTATGSDAKFEGEIQEDLKELIQEAIDIKRDLLKGFVSYCPEIILLLYDAYIFADINDVRLAFKEIKAVDFFNSIFWVQGLKKNAKKSSRDNICSIGHFLFSKNKNWLERNLSRS